MAMELFEALSTTRAVRRFTDAPISAADIMTCLRAATQAPSGGNIQPWQFLVVTDVATRRALGQVYRRAYDRYEPALLGARAPAPGRAGDALGSLRGEAGLKRHAPPARGVGERRGRRPPAGRHPARAVEGGGGELRAERAGRRPLDTERVPRDADLRGDARLVGAEVGHDRGGDRRAAVAIDPAETGAHHVVAHGRARARRDHVEREAAWPVPGVDPPVDVEARVEREGGVGG